MMLTLTSKNAQINVPYHTESVSQPVDNSKPKQLFWKKNIIFCEARMGTVKMIFSLSIPVPFKTCQRVFSEGYSRFLSLGFTSLVSQYVSALFYGILRQRGHLLTACNAVMPAKLKMAAREPQNCRRGLNTCLPLGFVSNFR